MRRLQCFTKQDSNIIGTDSLYEGLTVEGIAAESYVHAAGFYGTKNLTHLNPRIKKISDSGEVIDIASFDDRIARYRAIWNLAKDEGKIFK